MRVACVGEAMIELSMQIASAAVGVAGDTLNTAIYLRRAAPSIDVDYVTRLGDDPFSKRIKDFIASEDIGTQNIDVEKGGSPGLYAITLAEDGERSFTYWRGASAARGLFSDGDFSRLDGYDLIYLSGISMAILPHEVRLSLLEYLKQSPAKVAYDSNHRPRLWDSVENARSVTKAFWSFCDFPLPSVDDEMALFGVDEGAIIAACKQMPGMGALKRGAVGPFSIGCDVEQTYPAATKVADTTAAGDSFNGGYLGARLTGATQAQSLMAGHLLASKVIGHRGAIMPKSSG